MNKVNKDYYITAPLLPPMEEFTSNLKKIWSSGTLTNGGEFTQKLEKKLCNYIQVQNVSVLNSGTLALTIALKSLNLSGEIITTPFSHISTGLAIIWNNLKPVFVDVNQHDFNIDVDQIENAIGPKTSAILAVHIFGNPCRVEKIDEVAKKHNLKVIYDAAHCFGVEINNESVCNYGNLSVLSFHATKVFNCIEGGAIVTRDKFLKKKVDALKNFGLDENQQLVGYGLNAKMNEVQAAYGLVLLKHLKSAINKRKQASNWYREELSGVKGINLISVPENVKFNYSYFPIILNPFEINISVDEVVEKLQKKRIFPKRYFFPLITDYDLFKVYTRGSINTAQWCSKNVLCLPLSHELKYEQTRYIASVLKTAIK